MPEILDAKFQESSTHFQNERFFPLVTADRELYLFSFGLFFMSHKLRYSTLFLLQEE